MEHATHVIDAYGGPIFVRLVIERPDVPEHVSARVVSDHRGDEQAWLYAPGDQVVCHKSMVSVVETEQAVRMMRCYYCSHELPSDPAHPFFHAYPEQECDAYYCGCRGWD